MSNPLSSVNYVNLEAWSAPRRDKSATIRQHADDTRAAHCRRMKAFVIATRWLIRVLAVVQVVLGVLFWTNNALTLISLHMTSGIVLVVALWIQAIIAARAGIGYTIPVLAFVWGGVVIALGMRQDSLLVGDLHWLIQVLHLIVGLTAVAQAEALAGRTLRRLRPVAAAAAY